MTCIICGSPTAERRITCSETCHEVFVRAMEKEFGIFKKVIDIDTGKSYRVPTRHIIEHGLKQNELKTYPLWEELLEE